MGLKAHIKQGNIVAKAKLRPGCKKLFLENIKNIFCFHDADCVLNICCVGAQPRKHLGNTEKTMTECFSIVSSFAYQRNIF